MASTDTLEPLPISTDNATSAPSTPSPYSKPCTLCTTPRDVLIRCQIDDSGKWHFICPGKCWRNVSGGKVDGDGANKYYRYGGMWKNKHDAVSAKMKKSAKKRGANKKIEQVEEVTAGDEEGGQASGESNNGDHGANGTDRNHES